MTPEERKELERSFRKRQRNLEHRLGNLPKHYGRQHGVIGAFDIKIPAVEQYKEKILKVLPKGTRLSSLNDSELRALNRDLKYISNLKTADVKGFKNYVDIYVNEIQANVKQFSPDLQEKFWDTYNKLVEENELLYDFKYDVMGEIMDEMLEGNVSDTIINNIEEAFRRAYEKGQKFSREHMLQQKGFYTSKKLSKKY